MKKSGKQLILAICILLFFVGSVPAADWPQYRYDSNRSAASLEDLPFALHLQWISEYPQLSPAWPGEPRQQFDGHYEPVVMGNLLFFGSSLNDSVTALDTETGEEKWRFYTNGPVRFAPIARKEKVYFGSDDGYLYCVNSTNGKLIWKVKGCPSKRKVIGHERLISCWPVSGGPALVDNTIYFAAGIWAFEGVFIYGLDTETGDIVWQADGMDFQYVKNSRGGEAAFRGATPQGYLVVTEDQVIVPCGRGAPACYDRKTGRFLYRHSSADKSNGGGPYISAGKGLFFCAGGIFESTSGEIVEFRGRFT